MHVLVIMSCNDFMCIFKFGFLVNFIAHNQQGILCSKHIFTLIRSRPITTGLINHNKFFRNNSIIAPNFIQSQKKSHTCVFQCLHHCKLKLHRKNHFQTEVVVFLIKLAIILLSWLCYFSKMELLLTYALWSPFLNWTFSSLSGCILLEGHYILKNSVLGQTIIMFTTH